MASPELNGINQPLPKIIFHLRVPYSRLEKTRLLTSALLLIIGFASIYLGNTGYLPNHFGLIGIGVDALAGVNLGTIYSARGKELAGLFNN